MLEGITRKVAMELCKDQHISVEETNISLEQFLSADELFATTTGGGIVPITRANQNVFSNDVGGEVTLVLQESYWRWHKESEMSEAIDY